MNYKALVAQWLLQINAIKLSPQSPFTWSSGLKSPIYCDNRITLSYPTIRKGIVAGLMELSQAFRPFDTVAGVATAGIPHGALLADALNLPFVYVRSKAKAHGRQNQIEGVLQEGAKVLVVEDLISTGGSSIKAVQAIKASGVSVVGTVALFSYGFEQAQAAFAAEACPFATLTNFEVLLEIALSQQAIAAQDLATLNAWRKNPTAWSAAVQA